MKLDIFVSSHKERLVVAVVDVRNNKRTVDHTTRLGPLVVHPMCRINGCILCRHALIGIRIQIRIPKDVVGRAVIAVRSGP